MIIIQKQLEGDKLTVRMAGRLDTMSAPKLQEELNGQLDHIKELEFDLQEVEYISSSGLRVLLSCQKIMNRRGKMIVRNVQEDVMEIFEVTGFTELFTIV